MDEKQEIILEWPCNNISIDYSLGNVFVYLTEQAYKLYNIMCLLLLILVHDLYVTEGKFCGTCRTRMYITLFVV